MRRRDFMMAGPIAVLPFAAAAKLGVLPRVRGLINVPAPRFTRQIKAFEDGLREFGFDIGGAIDIAYAFAGDNADLPKLAAGLVAEKPAVLVAFDPDSTAALSGTTKKTPIVSAILTDPVGLGLVASLAHPGGNVTGILAAVEDFSAKGIEIAAEINPSLSKLGLLINPTNVTASAQRQVLENASRSKGISLVVAGAGAPAQISSAIASLTGRAQALLVMRDGLFSGEATRIASAAESSKLPTIFSLRVFVDAGGLISYGVDLLGNYRRTAYFVAKVLNGAKPADLPVEFPTKFETVVNLRTAKELGLTMPPAILLRASEVIE